MACLKNLDNSTRHSQTSSAKNLSNNAVLTVAQKRRIRRKNGIQRKSAANVSAESKSQPNTDTKSDTENSTIIDDITFEYQVVTDVNETATMKSRNNSDSKSADSTHNKKIIMKNSQHETQLDKKAPKNEGKTREEILAEREAKKDAKQKTKLKTVTSDAKSATRIPNNAPKASNVTTTVVPKQSAASLKIEDATPNSKNIKPTNSAKIELSQNKSGVQKNTLDSKNADYKSEGSAKEVKSREEIKAEREAKKNAKQLAKSRVKGDIDSVPSKAAESLTKKANTNTTKTELESKKSSDVDKLSEKLNAVQIQTADKEAEDAKSKASLRAERRAKQEAQRAAKENAKTPVANISNTKVGKTSKEQINVEKKLMRIEENKAMKVSSLEKTKVKAVKSLHKVKLFQHLYAEREAIPRVALNSKDVHPAMVRLGVQYASRVIAGSNARCISLLNALKVLVKDYVLPAKTEFARGLETYLASNMAFLKSQRPLAVSMVNALKHLRWQLTQLPNNITEFDAKTQLNEAIDTYIREQIEVAGQAISIAVQNKISNGDVILTYGCSSLIEKMLCEAWVSMPSFSVVVVGSRPGRDGHELLRRLTNTGLPCTYVDITALSYVMRKTNKVLLGAGALLANGSVMARAGTAQVALVAHAHNVPVLVCCETHKFSERVQTDSFVYNEIGDPDELVQIPSAVSPLRDWRSIGAVTPLNLTYDVTPPDLVTAVVTELAILPCTSVPVVLRFKLSEYGI